MSINIDHWPIADERLNSAIGNLAFFARRERDAASIYRKLAASELVGKIATRALLPQAKALFPDWTVYYLIEDYGERKRYLRMFREDGSKRETVEIYLATMKDRRIEADKLKQHAKERMERAAVYTKKAEDLPLKVAQLNAVLPYILDLESAAQDVNSYATNRYYC